MHVSKGLSRTLQSSARHTLCRPSLAPRNQPQTPKTTQVVLYSSQKEDAEPSWGEIAKNAGGLLRTAFNKVKNSAAALIKPKQQSPPPREDLYEAPPREDPYELRRQQQWVRPREQPRQGLTRPSGLGSDDLLPGLFGRAAGSLLGNAFDMLGSELAKSSKERETVFDEARRRITSSPALKQRLGNPQVFPPTSQSSSTTSINGRSTQKINLVMPIQGSSGALAYGQVEYASEGGKRSSCLINVRMPEGDTVRVDEVDASGQTIDVDFREIS